MSVSWTQALAWRMRRQMLDPAVDLPADEVVRRLGGVQAKMTCASARAGALA